MTTGDELDEVAERYYQAPQDDLWLEERVQDWILPWIGGRCRGRVLEMGWGTGLVAKGLVEVAHDLGWLGLTVVEGSDRLVVEARLALGDRATVVASLFEEYDPGPIFDTVLALHVLEHVEEPVRMLERIWGWLRPGGRLIAVVPNAQSIHRRVGALMSGDMIDTLSDRDRLVGHRRVYRLQELCVDLAAARFDTAGGAFGWFHKPVHNALMVRWAPELIDALCDLGWHGPVEDAANIGVIARRS